jgi:hypothetical protein
MKEAAMPCQDFPRKRGHARLFFVAALLTLLLPLQVARAAMAGWAAGGLQKKLTVQDEIYHSTI